MYEDKQRVTILLTLDSPELREPQKFKFTLTIQRGYTVKHSIGNTSAKIEFVK